MGEAVTDDPTEVFASPKPVEILNGDEILNQLRLAYIALLEAATFATESGDAAHEAYFVVTAAAAKAILERYKVIGLYKAESATP